MYLLAAGCPSFNSRSLCFKAVLFDTTAGVREMEPVVNILRIIRGLALALFWIPINHSRRTVEYNSTTDSVFTCNDPNSQIVVVNLGATFRVGGVVNCDERSGSSLYHTESP